MKKRFIKTLVAISAITMFMVAFGTDDRAALAADKNLSPGETWVVNETAGLTGLAIARGAKITAPRDHSVTMTIDGVETPIKEGSYKGKIVLSITKNNIITASVFGDVSTYNMRAAIDVEDGVYIKEKSVEAAVAGGKVTNTSAKDVSITSVGDNFNGIIIQGKSTYTIGNPKIKLTGHGGNDFAGYGAGIMTEGSSNVTINKASIVARGAIRTAIVVRGSSVVHVNDSAIEVFNGPLPEDYAFKWQKPIGPLMQVPWFLGLTGTNRATMLIENGTAYYNNTHIKAQGWGALSTDSVQNVKLYATNCHIEVVDSGYGSYADGSTNTFSKTKFDVKDYALIMTGGSGVFTDECVVNSGRFGVMFHGAGDLTIDKGSVFNTKEAVIQVKGGFPTIVVDNAKLTAENGLILQAMVNDDPNKGGGSGGGAPEAGQGGMPGAAGGAPGAAPGSAPGGMPGGPGGGSNAVTATFKNMTLLGDIVNSMTNQGDVVVNFEKAAITGAITTATAEHAAGPRGEKLVMKEETDLYYLIGKTKETYCATNDKYGVKVSLDGSSKWVVNKTSYLTSLAIAKGADITAPKGYTVTMTVDGVKKTIRAGDYKGKIVLTVTKA